MHYSQEEFLALMQSVEDQDGVLLDEDCSPDRFRLKTSPTGPEKVRETQACHNPTLFDIPYPLPDGSDTVNVGVARVCAVCDNVGMWPRFMEEA